MGGGCYRLSSIFFEPRSNLQEGAFSSSAFGFEIYWDYRPSSSSPTMDLLHVLQGRNCEHNYDDCLVNPCPEGFSCIDGINEVSCLPPGTDDVLLEATARNISHGLAATDPASVAELSAGTYKWEECCKTVPKYQFKKQISAFKWVNIPSKVPTDCLDFYC